MQRPRQYDTLIRVRQRQEDMKAQALAATRREIRVARAHREQLARDIEQSLLKARIETKSLFDASDVRRQFQHARFIARQADGRDAAIRALENEAESRRRELEEASQRKRMVEKLRERRLLAYHRALRKQEQRLGDDVAAARAALGLLGWENQMREPEA